VLAIKAIMGTAVEDIFAFKCCGARIADQNLEIHLTNHGNDPVVVPSFFDLIEENGPHRINTLLPHGPQTIEPQATVAFYCAMDEAQWKRARRIAFYDINGNTHQADIDQAACEES
jgi:hypothetical protein